MTETPSVVAATGPAAGRYVDSGILALTLVARFHGLAVDEASLLQDHAAAGQPMGREGFVRAARRLGLKARAIPATWPELAALPKPAVLTTRSGTFLVLAGVGEDKALIQDFSGGPGPAVVARRDLEAQWSGTAILLSRRPPLAGMTGHFDLTWFVPALLKYRHLFGEVLVASFVLQLLALITPLFFQVVIDKVLVHRGLTTLDVLGVGLLIVIIFETVLGALRTYLFSHTTSRVDVELGARLYDHLQRLPISYFGSRPVGAVAARVRELETLRGFLTGSTLTVAIDVVFTVVFLAVMIYYSGWLSLIVLGSLPFYIVLSLVVTPILRRRLEEKFAQGALNQAFLVESIGGMETVKAMAIEPQMQRRWEEQLAGYVSASFRAGNLSNVAGQIAGCINKLVTLLILWVGARLVIAGELSVGQLVAFNMLAGRVGAPLLRLAQLWQDFQQARISMEKLGDVLNTPTEPTAQQRSTLPAVRGHVRLDHVSFRYSPDRPEVLSAIHLDVPPGQVVGIVGRSGSGKSTLAKLIQRLYVPFSGRVLIDGVDLALVDPRWLRRQVGVVLQDSMLFNRTVRENIALADPALSMEKIVDAAKLAGAHDFVLQLPHGYDTVVEEHGSNLSGGQKQRLAIARALVTNPRILIFDEATSALDYESERVIHENMRHICRGRTVFIIAHRLSAVRDAHRIILIQDGRIAEEGSHVDLIARQGSYAALFAQQAA